MTPAELRAARLALGLTQEQLALACGYAGPNTRIMICAMEAGKRPVSARLVAMVPWLLAAKG